MKNNLLEELPEEQRKKLDSKSFPEWTDDNKLHHPRFLGCAPIKNQPMYIKNSNLICSTYS